MAAWRTARRKKGTAGLAKGLARSMQSVVCRAYRGGCRYKEAGAGTKRRVQVQRSGGKDKEKDGA